MSAGAPETGSIEVQVIADLACPWCYLGFVRLERARRARPRLATHLRWWPFLLNPQLPPDGMDRATYLRAKFGGEAAARQVLGRIEAAAATDRIPLALERIRRTPNSALAQRMVLHAETQGQGEAAARALFEAFYLEGRDIGRCAELLAIGAEAGLDAALLERVLAGPDHAAAILRGHHRATDLGVRGVPVYVIDGEHAIAGAQPPEILASLLDLAASAPAAPPAAAPVAARML
jgi:predicted DsbA family dithiol-disulfide isomerase